MKYLTLGGLFIMMVGGFFPFRANLGYSQYLPFWLCLSIGVILMLFFKNNSFDNSRSLGATVALFIGIITAFSIMDTLNMPAAAGFSVGKGIPIILFGVVITCLGGFSLYQRMNSLNYYIGLAVMLLGFIFILFLASFVSFYYDQFLWLSLKEQNMLSLYGNISFMMVFGGAAIMVWEFVRTFVKTAENS